MAFHQNHQKKPDILYRSSRTVKNGDQFDPDLHRKPEQHPEHKTNPSSSDKKKSED